ncbi:MAG: hypothetical protein H0X17_08675 [Deltaproteobacteria bacterium]|nr:hypothetical protein [Deltaproteobacteria bacterium]
MRSKLGLLVLAGSLASCGSPRAGTRLGSGSAFAGLELAVHASRRLDEPIEVTVSITGTSRACFVAPEALEVAVDGQRLVLQHRGGPARPTMISGAAILMSPCTGATYRSRAGASFPPTAQSVVTITHERRQGRMAVRHLLAPRELRIEPSNQLRAGDRVTLTWSPATDEWGGYGAGVYVHLYEPDDFSTHGTQLAITPPHFRFTVPATIRPGPARVSLATVYLEAHPAVLLCHGMERCTASAAMGRRDLAVTILPPLP